MGQYHVNIHIHIYIYIYNCLQIYVPEKSLFHGNVHGICRLQLVWKVLHMGS